MKRIIISLILKYKKNEEKTFITCADDSIIAWSAS